MTRDEAKQVLLLYRPWTVDPQDPEMTVALALAQTDPDLRSWFDAHCALQLAVRDSVRTQNPPEAFREQIVSECLAQKRMLSRRRVIATATALLLGIVGFEAYWLFGRRGAKEEINFAAYRREMSGTALRLYQMDLETANLDKIRGFLASRRSPSNYVIPAAVAGLKATGCLATTWQGRPVSMICFHTGKPLNPGRTSDLFLFVTDQVALPEAPAGRVPAFEQINRLAVASWSADGSTYLLATEQGEEFLRKSL